MGVAVVVAVAVAVAVAVGVAVVPSLSRLTQNLKPAILLPGYTLWHLIPRVCWCCLLGSCRITVEREEDIGTIGILYPVCAGAVYWVAVV